MESLWKLVYLLEPAPIALILTAITVSYASAFRALNYGKEMERNRDWSEASITLDRSQALMIPIVSSCSLLMMFYLFSSVSQLLTVFTAIASASSLYFCLFPYIAPIRSRFGLADPFVSQCCSKPFTRIQGLLMLLCIGTVITWLVSGHWILNNLLGISLCIAFVSHVRLPNIKICAMLLVCLFVYDIFWVFYSERFFGANVMVSVATQLASNPVHTVANSLSLPGLQLITKKLELPVKIIFPRNLLGGVVPGYAAADFIMLGLGDMAIPSMLLALVLCFDHRKSKGSENISDVPLRKEDISSPKGFKYIRHALAGYSLGVVTALAAGILTHSAQPALLYLVPLTLGPVIVISWMRKELAELWEGSPPNINEKTHFTEV
ncbi:Signal peptide peptidase-like 1 [Capsicum annuum]|uniref:Signal peptide peptidase-like 1 n=1 Tax=Capsicum annuum TaxID=4072 RepID=A0A1U8FZK0_CAPAN|nr:signal peptide peptidase-like 1 isoform X1 [Capsicum annuum]KAF3660597.1 Signal peptide peptidase-like 1 [Capsicum annuum]KAF3669220.1 Signal peptide peptidase-like 1 [Capsicum annuum]PHT87257.1 Signal peptide peptidase-like 1 [Capsicum annuum]